MELNEVPTQKLPTEPTTFNVIDQPSGKTLNESPLSKEEAEKFAKQLTESDATRPLTIRSNRFTIQE